jgi:hypothetical protein
MIGLTGRWRARVAAMRERGGAKAQQRKQGGPDRSAADERVILGQRLDAARERLRASIAAPTDADQPPADADRGA